MIKMNYNIIINCKLFITIQ